MRACQLLPLAGLFLCLSLPVLGQAPGVTIFQDGPNTTEDDANGPNTTEDDAIRASAEKLKAAKRLMSGETVLQEMKTRTSCELVLPAPNTKILAPRDLWKTARASYMRVGYFYLCDKPSCDKWHLNLAGGYVIADGGVVATCHHVILPDGKKVKDYFLICADDAGQVYPVTDILACDDAKDVAIIKTTASLPPLPLNVNVMPGDSAYLYSDPMGIRGYFSNGIVNRFAEEKLNDKGASTTSMYVSTDWTPGSSGAGVLDTCGNIIGHVSTIQPLGNTGGGSSKDGQDGPSGAPLIIMHQAARAADVLSLIKVPEKK